MNNDLQNLIANIPQPIIVLDEEKSECMMANKLMSKLLSVDEGVEDKQELNEKIKEQSMQSFEYAEAALNNLDINAHDCMAEGKVSLIEASHREFEAGCLLIRTKNNFENRQDQDHT